MVTNGAPWDYKSHPQLPYSKKIWNETFEDFGNFHYGVVGRAAGFSRITLLAGAGWNQLTKSKTKARWARSFFDDPRDQEMIRRGMNWYDAYTLSQTINAANRKKHDISKGSNNCDPKPWYLQH